MRRFLAALQFLTIFHVKEEGDEKILASAVVYFPLVGGLLGLALIALNIFLSIILPVEMVSILLVAALIIFTGALHLDGLADTFDALMSGKSKENMLEIMRDSHKGTFGVLALIIIILFKIALLLSLSQEVRNLGIYLMTTISRYSFNVAISLFPYARQEGKAKVFFGVKGSKAFLLSTLVTLILLALTMRWLSMAILALAIIFVLAICGWTKKIIGGLTGDTLGALCELSESFVLLSVFVISNYSVMQSQ